MPRNKGKGEKNRKRGKNEAGDEKDDKAYVIPKSLLDEARRLNEGIEAGVLDEDENEGGADDYVGLEDKGIDNIQRFSDQNSIYLPDVIFYRY
ncbi:hypothetical protein C1H46_019829 [Malus baccata]|uniref:Uncharacterized protein n=1 Tax=Malus baccata TaxID=106549 RepID=A0A540M757_MALBA|nr:hypothetical protein C1H46_019829 [Malus baccata]